MPCASPPPAEQKQHADIEYRALTVAAGRPRERHHQRAALLRSARTRIVFCHTRAAVNHLTARFANRGFSVVALSGELSQNERTHALQAMRDGRARVCVATDVAARGIDLPNLELVIHADLPTNPETLLHRAGRTGRAGRKGVSALIVPDSAPQAHRAPAAERRRSRRHGRARPRPTRSISRDDERMLADPAFDEPVKEDERGFVDDAARQAWRRTGGGRFRAPVPRQPLGARGTHRNRRRSRRRVTDAAGENSRAATRRRAAATISATASGSRCRSAASRMPSRAG